MTHDYKRHDTTTLFAALDVLEGKVIGRCMQRHRHQEFIRFLNAIEAEVPAGKVIHAILDNYAAHKHPKVRAWLGRHPRWVFHFTPTSCSWLNAVEGFFAKLTKRRLKRGVFSSIIDLQAAINRFLAETNQAQKPFTWTAVPDKIIAAVRRGPLGGRQSLTFASNVVLPSAHSARLFGHRSAFQAIRACLWCFMIGAVAVWARKNRGAVQCEIVRDRTSCGPALEFASGWIRGLLSYPHS